MVNNVFFHNHFVKLKELTEFIGAADIYITPYLGEAQSTSGTLAYAFGAGKAVISTPYWHAAELLKGERGVLVPFADPKAIAREVNELLRNETRRNAMSECAYKLGREMVWSKTAGRYMDCYESARREARAVSSAPAARNGTGRQPLATPDLNLDHLYRMTDQTGIFQHACLDAPNLSEGYCTDDNSRALILTVLLNRLGQAPTRVRTLAYTYAAFLRDAFNPQTARFHNFAGIDRQWLDEQGSEDSHGRAIWALGTLAGRAPQWSSQLLAEQLFTSALPAVTRFTSPRAWAFSIIGIHEFLRRRSGERWVQDVGEDLAGRLVGLFDNVAEPAWPWFERGLTYDNAKLAHALLISGLATGRRSVYDRGMRALRWLVGVQTARQGHLRPIGSNGFYPRDGVRADFDQQPIEAQATASACLEAYRATGDPWWHEQAKLAFNWFLGWNDLGTELYCSQTGGCRDGLHRDRANENRGAESTLAFLLSLAEMRLLEERATDVQSAGLAASII